MSKQHACACLQVVPNDFIGMQVAPQGIVDPT